MIELDTNGFIGELNSILSTEKNKKPVRITIKRYCPDIKGCKKKRKAKEEEKLNSGIEEFYTLVRATDGKKRKSRVIIKTEKDINSFISDLSKCLLKIDTQKKGQRSSTR
ncbi:Signal recognition particle SRP14 subunit [Cryptosporidium felis]|nr:Signal recognition particle SRP14 subunit [Cryptosporidium felis]